MTHVNLTLPRLMFILQDYWPDRLPDKPRLITNTMRFSELYADLTRNPGPLMTADPKRLTLHMRTKLGDITAWVDPYIRTDEAYLTSGPAAWVINLKLLREDIADAPQPKKPPTAAGGGFEFL